MLGAAAVAAVLILLLLVVLIPGGGGDPAPAPEDEAAAQANGGEAAQSAVARVMDGMSVPEKVGQLMAVGPAGTEAGDPALQALERTGYGGVVIEARNYQSVSQAEGLADAARAAARRGEHVEPWVLAPQEGGPYSALPGLPPEKPPGEIGTPKDAADAARRTAEELLEAGVTGTVAPVLDVGGEISGADRVYSDSEDAVSRYAEATIKAFEKAGIFAAPKHFPGLGAASQSTEEGPTNVGLTPEQLAKRDLVPFEAAIDAGAPGMLIGHGIYSLGDFVTPASLSPEVATDLLRGELGFRGVAIADDLTSPAITATLAPPDAAVDAVNAGVDMVYVGGDETAHRAVYTALLKAARAGDIDAERIDEAVERVLAAKRAGGLLNEGGEGAERQGSDGRPDAGE